MATTWIMGNLPSGKVLLEERINANQCNVIPTDHLYPLKHFYPDGSGLFQDDPAHIHRAQRLTDEYENNLSHMLWRLPSPDFNLI